MFVGAPGAAQAESSGARNYYPPFFSEGHGVPLRNLQRLYKVYPFIRQQIKIRQSPNYCLHPIPGEESQSSRDRS